MRKLLLSEFIRKSNIIHNNYYDYSETVYDGNHCKVNIICPIHGEFEQLAMNHLSGHGCAKCASEKNSDHLRTPAELFIYNSNIVHDDSYDYSKVIYVNNNIKVDIICSLHGSFKQKPSHHLAGHGCRKCATCLVSYSKTTSNEDFIKACVDVHGDIYDYSETKYKGSSERITVICKKHGKFKQFATHHARGCGCPKCTKFVSSNETKWLDSLSIPDRQYKITINRKNYNVDGYDKTSNTIFEFLGDYWHGNPEKFKPYSLNIVVGKTFGELYLKTIKREETFLQAGYNTVFLWESDYNKGANMPTYEYECEVHGIFEEEHSISTKLEYCPKCKEETGKETKVKRLISGGAGKGIVELTGHELERKTKEDIAKLKSEVYSSEKKYANFIGEERYHNLQKGIDRKW